MSKKIVVFGCDNSGKTTLATTLAEKINGEVVRSLGPGKTYGEQMEFMRKNLFDIDKNLVFDRFPYIEEETTGVVIRGKSNFRKAVVDPDVVNSFLKKVDLFILCFPGIDSIVNWGEREQMDGVKENAEKLVTAYNLMFDKLSKAGYNVIVYNWHTDSIENILEEVRK